MPRSSRLPAAGSWGVLGVAVTATLSFGCRELGPGDCFAGALTLLEELPPDALAVEQTEPHAEDARAYFGDDPEGPVRRRHRRHRRGRRFPAIWRRADAAGAAGVSDPRLARPGASRRGQGHRPAAAQASQAGRPPALAAAARVSARPLPAGRAGLDEAVRRIKVVTGISARVVATARVDNAAATAGTVLYNPRFFDQVRRVGGDSAVVGILAHEFGHLARGHIYRGPGGPWKSHRYELEADAEAGCALAKLGMPVTGYVRVTTRLAGGGSWSHPDGAQRGQAIQTGYAQCRSRSGPLLAESPRAGRSRPLADDDSFQPEAEGLSGRPGSFGDGEDLTDDDNFGGGGFGGGGFGGGLGGDPGSEGGDPEVERPVWQRLPGLAELFGLPSLNGSAELDGEPGAEPEGPGPGVGGELSGPAAEPSEGGVRSEAEQAPVPRRRRHHGRRLGRGGGGPFFPGGRLVVIVPGG